jgi:hypothetical protein
MPDLTESPDPEVAATVQTLLGAAGLAVSAEEFAVLVAQYPSHRAGVELLHSLPELRYESPAVIFTATPVFADWGSPA